jgi:hypothetical protein
LTPWYRDRAAWRLILRGYLPWLAALNLAWEVAHVRRYTLWNEATSGYIAFSLFHCTLGDVLIGGAALLAALVLGREGALADWRWVRVVLLTTISGVGYTVFSEWMNITLLRSWRYSGAMPTLDFGGLELGLTPLAQWLFVPALALYCSRRGARRAARRGPAG